MSTHSRTLILALPILLLGCTVGPDYKKPEGAVADQWISSDGVLTDRGDKDAETQQDWWQNFNDPILNQLIQKATTDNFDLKIAEARIAGARASQSAASSDLLPKVDVMGSATREANQFAIPGNFPGLTKPFNIFETGFDASWELDLFGGKRREVEAATAEFQASEASRDDVRVSLLAEVAKTYIDIRRYQAQWAITQATVDSNQNTFDIATQRFNVGDVAHIDVTEAEAQLNQAKSQLPADQNQLSQAEYRMDVLMGEQPGYAHKIVEAKRSIPVSDKKLILDAPSAVIAHRPDIRMAERKLAAATARQGVAVAQFFPDISLSGFLGLLNTDGGSLLKTSSKSWLAGSKVIWPILNLGQLAANEDIADAEEKEARLTYQKSIIAALADVESSVTAYTQQDKNRQDLARAVANSERAAEAANERYKEGLTAFIEVLDAKRTLFVAQRQLTDATAASSQDSIAVYKSLGGGWNVGPKAQ